MPAKRKSKPSKAAKRPAKAKAKPAAPKPSQGGATIECAECSGQFPANVVLSNFEKEVGKKFSCPSCGALYEIISLQESRITVTILAKGETRTYGKTYDLAAKPYAKPL